MPFLTTLQFPGTETAVERDIREVGQILSSTARDMWVNLVRPVPLAQALLSKSQHRL
jgi:hypothetical protein